MGYELAVSCVPTGQGGYSHDLLDVPLVRTFNGCLRNCFRFVRVSLLPVLQRKCSPHPGTTTRVLDNFEKVFDIQVKVIKVNRNDLSGANVNVYRPAGGR
jgi:hypothetical protein